jgi:hypothetical protein
LPDFNQLSKTIINQLNILWGEYIEDIERNANIREVSKTSSLHVDTFKEYKIVYSRNIIDKIDEVVGMLYGLTQEEINFIKQYEKIFRLSGDVEAVNDFMSRDKSPIIEESGRPQAAPSGGDGAETAPGRTRRRAVTETANDEDEELE